MMILCKTLLGYPMQDTDHRNPATRRWASDAAGLRILAAGNLSRPNVVASSSVVAKPQPERADPGSWGLHDADGGGLDLCTESLGAESCEGNAGADEAAAADVIGGEKRSHQRSGGRRGAVREFPPPLRWLEGRDGRRSRFMTATRTGGRIVLTEVQIERPEILRACREDGRLRLIMVESPEVVEEKVEEEEDEDEDEGDESTPPSPLPPLSRPRWQKNELLTCQEEVNGNNAPLWCSQRFVTIM